MKTRVLLKSVGCETVRYMYGRGPRRRRSGGGPGGGCARRAVGNYLSLHAMGVGNHLIEFEIKNVQHVPYAPVYNNCRIRRLLSLGPPNYAIQETYKSGLDR
jgi:hypothetical protein